MPAIFVVSGASAQPFSYVRIDTNIPSVNFGDVELADFNADGIMDVFALGNRSGEPPFLPYSFVALARELPRDGGPEQSFDVTPFTFASWHGAAGLADVDLDGDLDVLAAGAGENDNPFVGTAALFLGDGGGVLSETNPGVSGVYGSAGTWADFDGDGDADLVLAGVEAGQTFRTAYYRNDEGSLTLVDVGLPDLAYGDLDRGDFDGDGDVDLLVSGATDDGRSVTDVFANAGDGTFTAMSFAFLQPVFSTVEFGDYDNDGDLDVLVGGGVPGSRLFEGALEVYRNDGGVYSKLASELRGVFYGDALWGDYDNDGDLDILAFGGDQTVGRRSGRIYENDAGTFSHRVTFPGLSFADAAWGDYDSDGDLDIVVSGVDRENRPLINMYRNQSRLVNSPPEPPTDLQAVVDGGVVTLSWNRGADDQTPAEGLTYGVRVGKQTGAADVKSALASADGRRWLPDRGNVDHATSTTLQLRPGTYYWSVQSVDPSYLGSAFATEQTFSVTSSDVSTETDNVAELPDGIQLDAPYPNPFRHQTTIGVRAPAGESVRIHVFNALGAIVTEHTFGPTDGEPFSWTWDATAQGVRVASGMYFIHATFGGQTETTRVMLIR